MSAGTPSVRRSTTPIPATPGLLRHDAVDRCVQFLSRSTGGHTSEERSVSCPEGLIEPVMPGTGDEELIRIFDQQRLQHDRIEETEDRRRRADAERDRENRDDGEASALSTACETRNGDRAASSFLLRFSFFVLVSQGHRSDRRATQPECTSHSRCSEHEHSRRENSDRLAPTSEEDTDMA